MRQQCHVWCTREVPGPTSAITSFQTFGWPRVVTLVSTLGSPETPGTRSTRASTCWPCRQGCCRVTVNLSRPFGPCWTWDCRDRRSHVPTAVGNNSDVTRLFTRNRSSLPGRTLFSSRGRQAAKLTTSSLSLSATANPIPPDAFFTPIYSAAWPAPPATRSARQHHEVANPSRNATPDPSSGSMQCR